jgi:hypothetical protein
VRPVPDPLHIYILLTLCIVYLYYIYRSRGSVVGIATDYRLDDQGVGVRVPVGSRIFFSPSHPDRLWGPPNLLSNGYRGQSDRGVKLTTHLHLVPR